MATSTDRTEFISELVNLLAGPVSAGMKKAGEANQRRMQMQEHVEQLVDDAKKAETSLAGWSHSLTRLNSRFVRPCRS